MMLKIKKANVFLGMMLITLLTMSGNVFAGTYSGGDGTSGNPYQIATTADLIELSTTSGDWSSKYFIQTANISFDATEANVDWDGDGSATWDTEDQKGFSPIGKSSTKFTGEYDGDGYTIDNLYISRPAIDYIGLFGYTNGATITDLGVTNVDITGDDKVGGLVGYIQNSSTVSYSYSTGSVSGSGDQVGGLVGFNYSSTVSNSYSTGSVSGNFYVGGLVGYIQNSSTVSYSYSTGSVSGNFYVGGLVAFNNSSTVSNSFWDITIESTDNGIGTGKTTAEMKNVATFTDYTDGSDGLTTPVWDFETNPNDDVAGSNYWDIDGTNSINNGYPFLSWQNGEDVSLPVELTSFTADNSRAGEITLHWVTESEIENLGFILERRQASSGSSQAEWTDIASYIKDEALRGQGSVTYRTEYTFTDKIVESGQSYDYRLADVSYAGEKVYHALNVLGVAVTEIPEAFALFPAYPNPFNPETVIRYQLSADSDVSLQIYDVKGQMIETLLNKTQDPGFYKVNWKPNNLPSGVYFCKLVQGSHVSTQKLILLK